MIKVYNINGKDYRICPMEYLDGLNFTEDEIDEFIEEDTLYNSYCVGVLCELNEGMSPEKALEVMTGDPQWYKKYFWTPEERVSYEKRFVPILMKVLEYDLNEAWHEVEIWSGFGSVPSMYKGDDVYDIYEELHNKAYEELKKTITKI